jgi:hypothetical protein
MTLATVTKLPTARYVDQPANSGDPDDMWASVNRIRREFPGAAPEIVAARWVLNECLANDPRAARHPDSEMGRQRGMLKVTLQNLLNFLDTEEANR